jgi:hypothetical protein
LLLPLILTLLPNQPEQPPRLIHFKLVILRGGYPKQKGKPVPRLKPPVEFILRLDRSAEALRHPEPAMLNWPQIPQQG